MTDMKEKNQQQKNIRVRLPASEWQRFCATDYELLGENGVKIKKQYE